MPSVFRPWTLIIDWRSINLLRKTLLEMFSYLTAFEKCQAQCRGMGSRQIIFLPSKKMWNIVIRNSVLLLIFVFLWMVCFYFFALKKKTFQNNESCMKYHFILFVQSEFFKCFSSISTASWDILNIVVRFKLLEVVTRNLLLLNSLSIAF